MPTSDLNHELQTFAVELFEHCGGVADWPTSDGPGTVVVPRDVATAAHLPGEEFCLSVGPAPGTVPVNLAGEFLETASHVLDVAIPREGRFCIPERYLTSRDLSEKITRTFTWHNARAKWATAEPALIEYHMWTLHGSLRSQDIWDAVLTMAVNAENQAVVELPDVFQEPDVRGDADRDSSDVVATYSTAVAEGKRRLLAASGDFIRRIELRLERDRKRLHDYYRALSREADGSPRRAATAASPDEIAAKKRTVNLELRRKLAELQETYALRAELKPVVLARVRLPALVVPVVIQRKQATRDYRLYWNALLKKFEPLSCQRCRRATFSATFTNDDVNLLCTICAEEM